MNMLKKIMVVCLISILTVSGTVGLSVAGAATSNAAACSNGLTVFPRWYDGPICKDGVIISPRDLPAANKLKGDTTGIGSFVAIVALNIVTILLFVVGYVSLAFIIYGGFKYMINGDNSSGTSAAKKTILNAVIGLVLSIMSVAIIKFITGVII